MKKFCILSLLLLSKISIEATTVVYNMRISQTTRRQAQQPTEQPFIMAATGVGQFRQYYHGGHDSLVGVLGTFLYDKKYYYLRVDAAGGRVAQNIDEVCFSKNQSDDLLFMGGYAFHQSKRLQATISGLFGVPTHADTSLQGVEFGTGHIGIGAQADIAFIYHNDAEIMAAARYIRFISRHIPFFFEEECHSFDFNIGNVVDILIAHYCQLRKHHWLEVGYNPTFVFGARICPPLDDVVEQTDYIRNSFYAFYMYDFLIRKVQSAVIAGFSYGFDSRPKEFGLKNIFTGWLSFGIKF